MIGDLFLVFDACPMGLWDMILFSMSEKKPKNTKMTGRLAEMVIGRASLVEVAVTAPPRVGHVPEKLIVLEPLSPGSGRSRPGALPSW